MARQTQLVRSTGRVVSSSQPRDPTSGINLGSEIVFSLSGPVGPTTSPQWIRRFDGALVEIVALLGTPGSGPTSIQIKKNNVVAHTITIPAGGTSAHSTGLNIFFLAGLERLTDTVTTAGAGAVDLTIQHWFET